MAPFRVVQEFMLIGDPPTQAATDRVVDRLRSVAPESGPMVVLGIGRMQVTMTFHAEDAGRAVALATTTVGNVIGRGAARIEVEPAQPLV